MEKAKKSFRVLIDTGKEAMKAIDQVQKSQDIYSPALKHLAVGDAIYELFGHIQVVSKNEDLPERAKLTQVIQMLHEIANNYAIFFDHISEIHPDIIDIFLDNDLVNREQMH